MIFRALVASLVLSATGVSCFANNIESVSHTHSLSSIKVAKGLPPNVPSSITDAVDEPHHSLTPGRRGADFSPMAGHERKVMGMLEKSGVVLSDEQVEKLTELRGDMMKTVIPDVVHAFSRTDDVKDSLSSSTLDDDRIKKVFADIKVDIDSAYAKVVDHLISVAHVFTGDQRHKLRIAIDRWSLGSLGNTAAPASPGATQKPE